MNVKGTGLIEADEITAGHDAVGVEEKESIVAFGADGKLRVLVADDIADDVFGLVRVLRQGGHDVIVVDNHLAARAKAVRGEVDLVISDLAFPLPEMGNEFMQHAIGEGIPTIAHTNSPLNEIHPDVIGDLHGVITKTQDRLELAARLSEILHHKNKLVSQQE